MSNAPTRAKKAEGEAGDGHGLRDLAERLTGVRAENVPDIPIHAIRVSSAEVQPGDLFVALKGTARDGHDFIPEALDRGAAALVVERQTESLSVPVLQVANGRMALAELAAAWHGHPAGKMTVLGITGTVGKTSVLAMLETIMTRARRRVGTVGSLGVHLEGIVLSETGHTAPDPLQLHENLEDLRAAGCELLAMEATSHALDQHRLHGIRFDVGIFTNLLLLEHQDYHGTFARYVEAKSRFLDQVGPSSPIVYNADDRVVDTLVSERGLRVVPTGIREGSHVRISDVSTVATGTSLVLHVERPLPIVGGGKVEPMEMPLRLRILGRGNVHNAALAAAAALVLGARPSAITEALEDLPPAHRRMELIYDGDFHVLDDTVGHPDSVSALFEAVESLSPRGIHIAFAIRGSRGPQINRYTAETLSIWARRMPISSLAITRSEDTADERNRVTDDEVAAFLEPLRAAGQKYEEYRTLEDAVDAVLGRTEAGDLVLLLGAQGMDAAGEMVRDRLG